MEMMQRFALVDCAVDVPTLYQVLGQQVNYASVQAKCLFDNQKERDLARAGPWLIALSEAGEGCDLEVWLNELARRHPAVTWLLSAGGFEMIFAHLEKQIDIKLPDGTLAMNRFWDPRGWIRLQRILTAEQRIELMGPIAEWRTMCRGKYYCASLKDDSASVREVAVDVDAHI